MFKRIFDEMQLKSLNMKEKKLNEQMDSAELQYLREESLSYSEYQKVLDECAEKMKKLRKRRDEILSTRQH